MKTKLSLALALISTLTLCSCDDGPQVTGTLALKSSLLIKTSSGGSVTLPAGKYATTAVMDSDGASVTVTYQSQQLNFKLPGLTAAQDGSVNVAAATLGQVFSLSGKIADSNRNFDRVVNQSCVSGVENQCDFDGPPVAPGMVNEPSYECHDVTDYGSQQVHEVGSSQIRSINISLLKGKSVLGTFAASYNMADTVNSSAPLSFCN